jgi:hypothetical protein
MWRARGSPGVDGVQDKLTSGPTLPHRLRARRLEILLARAYPDSAFTGSDYHSQSIEIARKRR